MLTRDVDRDQSSSLVDRSYARLNALAAQQMATRAFAFGRLDVRPCSGCGLAPSACICPEGPVWCRVVALDDCTFPRCGCERPSAAQEAGCPAGLCVDALGACAHQVDQVGPSPRAAGGGADLVGAGG